jgi:CubicO group peptidase (beta-lactamase class C family)
MRTALCSAAALILAASPAHGTTTPERARTHDNRVPAGRLAGGVLAVELEARRARWYPQAEDGPFVEVQAFAAGRGPAQIPAPLLRVPEGTEVRATVRNRLADPLVVHGLHTRPGGADDTVHVAPGASREVRFRAGRPGTYFYWASTTGNGMEERIGADSQLSGAFVVDPAGGARPDRVFVMGAWLQPGATEAETREVMTVNGKGWPHTERFTFERGDTVRWRWVNPTWSSHPMHLHGFYFRVDSRGAWAADTVYAPAARRLAVTELMLPGGTAALTWVPEREGNWLFHCHFPFHMSPGVSLPQAGAQHAGHPGHEMAGLVLGIHVRGGRGGAPAAAGAERRLRLVAQDAPRRWGDSAGMGYVLDDGSAPLPADSIAIPGPVLVLRRGEPVAVTVVNRLAEPTSVHWHGMELESFPDGVPGWSGTPGQLAPAIAPGDSFTARFTPPRAGTFIYHPHQNELGQISSGLYGALIVVEPDGALDPRRDHVLVVGQAGPTVDSPGLVNGSPAPPPLELRAGETHRLRLINITNDWRVTFTLRTDTALVRWRAVAKDGAALPPAHTAARPAFLLTGPGETADFEVTPDAPGEYTLEVKTQLPGWYVPVRVRVRPAEIASSRADSLDRFMRAQMAARHLPGAALAVVRGGRVLHARGYGSADLAHGVPATDSTVFLVASVTKTFAAVAALMLVEEGRVALDAPIGTYVRDLPAAWRPATVRQLLQHTSGISSITDHARPPCPSAYAPDRARSTRDVLAEVGCLPLGFAPGTRWSYSDTGYLLLGLMVESVAARPFEGFLRERVLAPLGMASTRMLDAEAVVPRLARGYAWDGSAFRNAPELHGTVEFTGGGLVSTVHDMARWAAALGSERLLRRETWALAWTPAPVGDAAYGMGFALRPVAGMRHVGHTGGGPGAATALAHFPDEGLSVVLLTNGAQPPFTMRDLAGEVAGFFRER